MRRRVLGVIWGDDQPDPGGIRRGVGVAVSIAGADGSHWTPEVVEELGIPASDERVSGRGRKQGEEPRVVYEREPLRDGDPAPGAVPQQQGLVGPEAPDVGLLGGARAAGRGPETLDLIVIAGPCLTDQLGRGLGPKL